MIMKGCVPISKIWVPVCVTTLLVFQQLLGIPAPARREDGIEFPGIGNNLERIRFHTGQVVDNRPQIFTAFAEHPVLHPVGLCSSGRRRK